MSAANEALPVIKIIRMIAPEFNSVDEDQIAAWQTLCSATVSERKFGKDYNQAVALLVCHKMKMAGLGSVSTGTIADSIRVSSYSEGGESISYSNPGAGTADNEYSLTSYGLQFLALRRLHWVAITIRGGNYG